MQHWYILGVDPINAESCQALRLSWKALLPQPLCSFPLPGVQFNRKVYFYNSHICFQFFKDQMSSVLPFTDIVFGNETEAAAYAESFELNTTDVGEIAMKIAQLPKENGSRSRLVVITQGSDPVNQEGSKTSLDCYHSFEQISLPF